VLPCVKTPFVCALHPATQIVAATDKAQAPNRIDRCWLNVLVNARSASNRVAVETRRGSGLRRLESPGTPSGGSPGVV